MIKGKWSDENEELEETDCKDAISTFGKISDGHLNQIIKTLRNNPYIIRHRYWGKNWLDGFALENIDTEKDDDEQWTLE